MRLYRRLIRPAHCYPGQGYEPKTELVEKEEKWYPEEEREHLEGKYGYLNEGHFSDLIFEEKYEPYLLKEQEAKTGKWIPVTNGRGGLECSICHDYAPSYQNGTEYLSKYCPRCGAKMERR